MSIKNKLNNTTTVNGRIFLRVSNCYNFHKQGETLDLAAYAPVTPSDAICDMSRVTL